MKNRLIRKYETCLVGGSDPESFFPLEILNEMIRSGWGHVPRHKIPDNWREIPAPSPFGPSEATGKRIESAIQRGNNHEEM